MQIERPHAIYENVNFAPFHVLSTRVDAEKSPFLTTKLSIRILPTVVIFLDGIATNRVVGFEDVSASDDFKTEELAKLLRRYKAIQVQKTYWDDLILELGQTTTGFRNGASDEDDDWSL